MKHIYFFFALTFLSVTIINAMDSDASYVRSSMSVGVPIGTGIKSGVRVIVSHEELTQDPLDKASFMREMNHSLSLCEKNFSDLVQSGLKLEGENELRFTSLNTHLQLMRMAIEQYNGGPFTPPSSYRGSSSHYLNSMISCKAVMDKLSQQEKSEIE